MSAPNENQPSRSGVRRAVGTGAVAALVVLAVGLGLLALQPRTATATATLTVTPRTDAGADAAALLADRYTALAGSAEVLDGAREDGPLLSEVPLGELQEGTEAERAPGTATVAVRVTLDDPDPAAAAANAVVGRLVEVGADEDLVDVAPGREATPARTTGAPATARWVVVSVLLALAAGLCAGVAAALRAGRRAAERRPVSADAGDDDGVIDDLPGFLAAPPGASTAPPTTGPRKPAQPPGSGATAVAPGTPGDGPSRVHAATATLTAALLLVAAAAGVAAPSGRAGTDALSAAPAAGGPAWLPGSTPAPDAPAPESAPGAVPPGPATPTSPTGTAAAALALDSVPLGTDGIGATAAFGGVLLEERPVGLTVTYPSVSVTTDGRRSLAHVRLPTYNCLTAEPPVDPVAAGCARSITEYADLADPDLQVTRDGDGLALAGLFRTYTRPNGSAPTYTGRAYQLAATIADDGPRRGDTTPATGVVRIGLDSATAAPDRGVNRLRHPG